MAAPTLAPKAATTTPPSTGGQATNSKAPAAVIPFTRASRKKSRLLGQFGPVTLNTGQQMLPIIQAGVGGYLRKLRLLVTGTTSGNSAATAFQNDAPFNVLQNITFTSPNGDSIISILDGFALYALNKYGAFATGAVDPVADPSFSKTTGSGATGGSFQFVIDIPLEIDARDAFCSLQNMAANQQFQLQLGLNSIAQLYSTAPTTAPQVTITAVMEYWSAPNSTNTDGNVQATAPIGDGSVALVQTQSPALVPNAQQNIQLLNVGNVIRNSIFILRDSSGVRDETDWPAVTNFYVNNDLWYRKDKALWRTQQAREYGFKTAPTAAPTAGALDNGVYILTDFMNDGSGAGDGVVSGSNNRDLWLVTGPGTAFNVEAQNWGASASALQVVQSIVKPSSPQALYAPHWD